MAVGPQESTIAPRFSRVLAVLLVAICVTTEVSLIAYGHLEPLLRATPALALVAVGGYLFLWAPLLRVTLSTIEVVNPLRTHVVSWPAVLDIETRWALTLVTARGRITVWAAPAQGPLSSVSRLNRDAFGRAQAARPGSERLPSTISAIAPMVVIRQWNAYREQGVLGAVEGEGTVTRWHRAAIVALTVLAALTVVTVLWR